MCTHTQTHTYRYTDSHTHTHATVRDAHTRLLALAPTREGKRDRKPEEGMWEGVFVNSEKIKTDIQKRGYNSLYTWIFKMNTLDRKVVRRRFGERLETKRGKCL